jgi:hypothetical protein
MGNVLEFRLYDGAKTVPHVGMYILTRVWSYFLLGTHPSYDHCIYNYNAYAVCELRVEWNIFRYKEMSLFKKRIVTYYLYPKL